MPNKKPTEQYPFNLIGAFFTSLSFERENAILENVEVPIEIQIKIIDKEFPKLQVNLKTRTPDQSPVKFSMELIGLFEYTEKNLEIGRSRILEFVNTRGLHMLWPYASQMIRIITSQMGMNPLNTKTPVSFNIPPQALKDQGQKQKTQKRKPRSAKA